MIVRWLSLAAAAVTLSACAQSHDGYQYHPYTVKGVHYVPMLPQQAPGYVEEGTMSHYMEGWFIFPGKTSLGEHIWPWSMAGANKILPLPCRVRVTNLRNGKSVVIRLNDRGPFVGNRDLDVTDPVAKKLGFYDQGLAPVRIKVLSVGDGHYRIRKQTIPRPELPGAGSQAQSIPSQPIPPDAPEIRRADPVNPPTPLSPGLQPFLQP